MNLWSVLGLVFEPEMLKKNTWTSAVGLQSAWRRSRVPIIWAPFVHTPSELSGFDDWLPIHRCVSESDKE